MTYDIRLTKRADKDFSQLGKVKMQKAAQALTKLKTDPYACLQNLLGPNLTRIVCFVDVAAKDGPPYFRRKSITVAP